MADIVAQIHRELKGITVVDTFKKEIKEFMITHAYDNYLINNIYKQKESFYVKVEFFNNNLTKYTNTLFKYYYLDELDILLKDEEFINHTPLLTRPFPNQKELTKDNTYPTQFPRYLMNNMVSNEVRSLMKKKSIQEACDIYFKELDLPYDLEDTEFPNIKHVSSIKDKEDIKRMGNLVVNETSPSLKYKLFTGIRSYYVIIMPNLNYIDKIKKLDISKKEKSNIKNNRYNPLQDIYLIGTDMLCINEEDTLLYRIYSGMARDYNKLNKIKARKDSNSIHYKKLNLKEITKEDYRKICLKTTVLENEGLVGYARLVNRKPEELENTIENI